MRKKIGIAKKLLRSCLFTVPLVSLISSAILYFGRQTDIAAIFIVTLSAWLASDVLILLFMKGGNGILKIPIFGNKAQFKSYGFLIFFIAIFFISMFLNVLTNAITLFLSVYFEVWYLDIGIGFLLSLLVFADLNMRYYTH